MFTRLFLTALLTFVCADTALATTAAVAPSGVLQVTTTAGEANVIAVERDAAGPVLVAETGAALVAGAGCQDRPDLGGVLCTGVSALAIDAGDGDDRVTLRDAAGIADDLPATVAGGDGADVITAGESPVQLLGGAGDDELAGGPGADVLTGDDGADVVHGAGGDDKINGGTGADTVDAGDGNDAIVLYDSSSDSALCGPAVDLVSVDARDTAAADCERIERLPPPCSFSPTTAGVLAVLADRRAAAGRRVLCLPPPTCPTAPSCVRPPEPCAQAQALKCTVPAPRFAVTVTGRRRQAAGRRVAVSVRCSAACRVRARAVARIGGRRVELISPTRSLAGERTATLRLRAPRALAGRRIGVVVTALDASGTKAVARHTIALRRAARVNRGLREGAPRATRQPS